MYCCREITFASARLSCLFACQRFMKHVQRSVCGGVLYITLTATVTEGRENKYRAWLQYSASRLRRRWDSSIILSHAPATTRHQYPVFRICSVFTLPSLPSELYSLWIVHFHRIIECTVRHRLRLTTISMRVTVYEFGSSEYVNTQPSRNGKVYFLFTFFNIFRRDQNN